MIRYDYLCDGCGYVQEESHPMSGPIEEICCKKCGSNKIKKTFESTNAIIFKGDDWATNKYR